MKVRQCGVALVSLLVACGDRDDEPRDRPTPGTNVLLVVIDTLRRDHLTPYGHTRDTSPALDALSNEALRFDRAMSQAPWTTPSIGSLLTSRYPRALGIRGEKSALSDDETLISETLFEAGYDTAAVISHSFLGSDWNFDQGFARFDESNVLGHAAVTSAGVTQAATRELERMASGDAPFFLFVHYFDPHAAYVEHDAYRFGGPADYDGPIASGMLFKELRDIERDVDPDDADELRRLYDSEIRFTDLHLGQLFDALRAAEAWDDTLIIVTADHGEEFLDHGRLGHAKSLYDELVGVPLIVKAPKRMDVAPGVVERPVALIDVVPTILHATDIAAAAEIEGVSLFDPSDQGRALFTETARPNGNVAVVDGPWKLLQRGRKRVELFDLAQDPGERNDLSAEYTDVVDRLRGLVHDWEREQGAKAKRGAPVELDARERERIENLGYGGGD